MENEDNLIESESLNSVQDIIAKVNEEDKPKVKRKKTIKK